MMFLYLCKWLYLWLLPLGGIVLALFLLTGYLFYRKGKGRWPLLGITLLLYFLSCEPFSNLLVHPLEETYDQPARRELQGDVIILLGGGSLTGVPDFDGSGQITGDPANRLLTALRLQRATGLPILFSGGTVYSGMANEAEIEKRMLLSLGVPEDKIFLENKSRNTAENAAFSQEIAAQQGWQRPILVTSAFHLPRAVRFFARAGFTVLPYPCDYLTDKEINWSPYSFIPQAYYLSNSCTVLKEYAGIAALSLRLQ